MINLKLFASNLIIKIIKFLFACTLKTNIHTIYHIFICVDPDPYSEYGSRSTNILSADPIWIRIHNTGGRGNIDPSFLAGKVKQRLGERRTASDGREKEDQENRELREVRGMQGSVIFL